MKFNDRVSITMLSTAIWDWMMNTSRTLHQRQTRLLRYGLFSCRIVKIYIKMYSFCMEEFLDPSPFAKFVSWFNIFVFLVEIPWLIVDWCFSILLLLVKTPLTGLLHLYPQAKQPFERIEVTREQALEIFSDNQFKVSEDVHFFFLINKWLLSTYFMCIPYSQRVEINLRCVYFSLILIRLKS